MCIIGGGGLSTSTIGPIVSIGDKKAFFTHGHGIGPGSGAKAVTLQGGPSLGSILVNEQGADKDLPDWGFCLLNDDIDVTCEELDRPAGSDVKARRSTGWVEGTYRETSEKDGHRVSINPGSIAAPPGVSGMAVVGAGGLLGMEYASQGFTFWVQPWGSALVRCRAALQRLSEGFGSNRELAGQLVANFDSMALISLRFRAPVVRVEEPRVVPLQPPRRDDADRDRPPAPQKPKVALSFNYDDES